MKWLLRLESLSVAPFINHTWFPHGLRKLQHYYLLFKLNQPLVCRQKYVDPFFILLFGIIIRITRTIAGKVEEVPLPALCILLYLSIAIHTCSLAIFSFCFVSVVWGRIFCCMGRLEIVQYCRAWCNLSVQQEMHTLSRVVGCREWLPLSPPSFDTMLFLIIYRLLFVSVWFH